MKQFFYNPALVIFTGALMGWLIGGATVIAIMFMAR